MTGKRFFGITTLLIIGLGLTILFGGLWVTAAAAQGALPGDALYSVKTGLETARTSITRDAAADARLHLGFAEKRLDEMAALIEAGRFEGLKEAAANFDFHVSAAIRSLALVARDDAAQANELALSISAALARDAELLTGLIARVPASSMSILERALQTSQQAQLASEFEFTGTVESIQDEVWVVSMQEVRVNIHTELEAGIVVGDLVEVEGFISTDGFLVAREIELAMDDNGNMNDNDNDNGNLNDNDNSNLNDNDGDINDNDDTNLNTNDNDINDNDDSNINDNDNDDGNLNDNDDDINDNDDGNLNDNDDDINDNDNTGMNDNGGDTNDNDNSGGGAGGGGGDDNDNGGGGDNDNG